MKLRLRIICALLLAGTVHADGIRDPMRPAGAAPRVAKPATQPSLKLEGIIAGGSRVAIVNGRLVRAGDSIGSARILEVFANGVRYERAGKITTLTLPVVHASSAVRVARKPQESRP
jgi:MSHA biogenesis protein MshK